MKMNLLIASLFLSFLTAAFANPAETLGECSLEGERFYQATEVASEYNVYVCKDGVWTFFFVNDTTED